MNQDPYPEWLTHPTWRVRFIAVAVSLGMASLLYAGLHFFAPPDFAAKAKGIVPIAAVVQTLAFLGLGHRRSKDSP